MPQSPRYLEVVDRGTGRKIGLKLENAPKSQIFRGQYFRPPPQEYQNMFSFLFLADNINLLLQESQKLQKSVLLHNFPTIPPTLHLSLF